MWARFLDAASTINTHSVLRYGWFQRRSEALEWPAIHVLLYVWCINGKGTTGQRTFMLTPVWSYERKMQLFFQNTGKYFKKFSVGIFIWKVMRSLLLQKSALWRNLNTQFSSEWEEVISQQVTLSVNVFMAFLLLFILLNPQFCHSSHWTNKVVPWGFLICQRWICFWG